MSRAPIIMSASKTARWRRPPLRVSRSPSPRGQAMIFHGRQHKKASSDDKATRPSAASRARRPIDYAVVVSAMYYLLNLSAFLASRGADEATARLAATLVRLWQSRDIANMHFNRVHHLGGRSLMIGVAAGFCRLIIAYTKSATQATNRVPPAEALKYQPQGSTRVEIAKLA